MVCIQPNNPKEVRKIKRLEEALKKEKKGVRLRNALLKGRCSSIIRDCLQLNEKRIGERDAVHILVQRNQFQPPLLSYQNAMKHILVFSRDDKCYFQRIS